MAVKRKSVAKSAASAFKGARGMSARTAKKDKVSAEASGEQQEQVDAEDAAQQDGEGEDDEEEEVDEEIAIAQKEDDLRSARRKELKCTTVGDIKQLAEDCQLELANKADMIEAIVQYEAEQRAHVRAREKTLRDIMIAQKEELEALPLKELIERCHEAGVKAVMTKHARIELLLKQWQQNDGVEKALKKVARDAREHQLESLGKASLQKLCEQVGISPIVKEIAIDRIVRLENAAGRFVRPTLSEELGNEDQRGEHGEPPVKKAKKKDDMVEALVAQEANRKKALERKKLAEEAAANRRKELRAMSVDELKKNISSRGCDPLGKKDELVEQLFTAMAEDEAAAAKRAKLKSLGPDELKRMLLARGVEAESGKKDALVDAVLAHEVKQLEEVRRHAQCIEEVLKKKREELEARTGAELKDLCISKGLKQGLTKEDRVERLIEDIAASGDADEIVAAMAKETRRQELFGKEQTELLELCKSSGADPLVKDILIERILEYEDAFGQIRHEEPPAKRSRMSKR